MRNLLRMFPKTATTPLPRRLPEPLPPHTRPWVWAPEPEQGIGVPGEDPCGRPPISSKEAS